MAGQTKSRIEDIYDLLKVKGYDVYYPSQHEGECTSPYVVVRMDDLGQVAQLSTDFQYYSLLAYVPKDEYGLLEPYVERIKFDMKELYPTIVSARQQTPSFYDDLVKGHMVSMRYRNARKWNNQKVFDNMPDWR